MKKLFLILLSALMIIGLVSCTPGGGEETTAEDGGTTEAIDETTDPKYCVYPGVPYLEIDYYVLLYGNEEQLKHSAGGDDLYGEFPESFVYYEDIAAFGFPEWVSQTPLEPCLDKWKSYQYVMKFKNQPDYEFVISVDLSGESDFGSGTDDLSLVNPENMWRANTDVEGYRVYAEGVEYTYRRGGFLFAIAWKKGDAVITLHCGSALPPIPENEDWLVYEKLLSLSTAAEALSELESYLPYLTHFALSESKFDNEELQKALEGFDSEIVLLSADEFRAVSNKYGDFFVEKWTLPAHEVFDFDEFAVYAVSDKYLPTSNEIVAEFFGEINAERDIKYFAIPKQ